MDMALVLKNYFSQPKVELGNRSMYVGASDVAQCPRKAILSKTHPAAEDLNTLIRYQGGTWWSVSWKMPWIMSVFLMKDRLEKKQTGNDGSAFEAALQVENLTRGKAAK